VIQHLKPALAVGALGIALMLPASPSVAQQAANVRPTTAVTKAAPIDPTAIAAINRMGDYLRTLKTFSIHADTTTDEVLPSGPKLQFGGTIDLTYRDPDGVHIVSRRDDRDDSRFFYNGKLLTVWVEARKAYAGIVAPATLGATLELVKEKYDVSFPLGGVLLMAARGDLLKDVKAGVMIGTGRIAGIDCDHLGFHQDGVDWQIWIEKGERPLPRKVLITTLSQVSQPQHSEILTWDLSPKIDPAMFTFVPPEGATRIAIAEKKTVRQSKATTGTKESK
jgi:hypothetical protein